MLIRVFASFLQISILVLYLQMASSLGCTKILFVCLGNICRSPAAEGVFKSIVEKNGLNERYEIDSCGTGGGMKGWYKENTQSYHEGDPADRRMRETAAKRNIFITSISRPLRSNDLDYYDLILTMDTANKKAIYEAAEYWGRQAGLDAKVKNVTEYCKIFKQSYVPDPYYGGVDGFEHVLDILTDACEGLLEETCGDC